MLTNADLHANSAHQSENSVPSTKMPKTARAPNSGRQLHLLIVSSTDKTTHIHGADRDWTNLLNALGPQRVRLTWAGIRDSESLARYLDDRLETRYLNLDFVPFYDLVYQSM